MHYSLEKVVCKSQKWYPPPLPPPPNKKIMVCPLVKTQLSIKLSKKNFGGILRPKSVRRTLGLGLIYGPRADKQFDIAFCVFWTLPGPVGHSYNLHCIAEIHTYGVEAKLSEIDNWVTKLPLFVFTWWEDFLKICWKCVG